MYVKPSMMRHMPTALSENLKCWTQLGGLSPLLPTSLLHGCVRTWMNRSSCIPYCIGPTVTVPISSHNYMSHHMWYDEQPSALRQAVQMSLESYHSGEAYHEHQ